MSNDSNKTKITKIDFHELDKSIEKLLFTVRDLKLNNNNTNTSQTGKPKEKRVKKKLNVELIRQLIKDTQEASKNNQKKNSRKKVH